MYVYIYMYYLYIIYIYVYISCHITRSTAFRWPCVFLMPGKLPMILDVLVPVGFCVIFCVKPVNACIYRQQNVKNYFAYTKPAFLWALRSRQLLGFHTVFSRLVFTAALQILPRTV